MRTRFLTGLALASTATFAFGQIAEVPQQAVQRAAVPARDDLEKTFDDGMYGLIPTTKPGSTPLAWITADMARARLKAQLALKVADVARLVSLTEAQGKKLRSAGELDIRRFFEHVEQVKDGLRTPSGGWVRGRPVGTARAFLAIEYQAGLFGAGSYYAKVLGTMVDENQAAALRKVAEERNRSRRRTRALLMAQTWGDALSLDGEQRRKLFELIDEKIPLPERNGLSDYPYLVYQFGMIPRDRLRPIFDDAQWKTLSHLLDQYKSKEQKDRVIELGFDLGEANPAKSKPETEPAK